MDAVRWTMLPIAALFAAAALPLLVVADGFAAHPGFDVSALAPALAFAFTGAAVSVAVGAALGAIAGTLELPMRRLTVAASAALIAAPPAFWWIGLMRLPAGFASVSGIPGGGVVAGVALAPITLLLVLAAAREIPSNAYEAARVGLSPVNRVLFVLVPLLRPALVAAFLLTGILLLGESEIPFLFGFRTAMTDIVTTFSETFDAARTVAAIVPLLATLFVFALLTARPLFAIALAPSGGGRGIIRKPGRAIAAVALWLLPTILLLALAGYGVSAFAATSNVWRTIPISAPIIFASIAEPVFCALASVAIVVVATYPLRRSRAAGPVMLLGLLFICVPAGVYAIGWIGIGQALGGTSIPPAMAYVSRSIALPAVGFLIACGRLPRSLDDAARLVPMSAARRAWTLVLPVLAPSLVATAALTAALIFADRDVASLLLPPGASRLMLNLYLLSANAPGAAIGATAMVVFAVGAAVIALAATAPLLLLLRRRE